MQRYRFKIGAIIAVLMPQSSRSSRAELGRLAGRRRFKEIGPRIGAVGHEPSVAVLDWWPLS
jgi:hypothetical protein